MEPLLAVVLTRALERIFVVCAGILSIYVGYRLFAQVPQAQEGEGKLKLPGGASFFMSRVGPGVFFALFGTGLIGYSATRPVSYSQPGFELSSGSGTDLAETGSRVEFNSAVPVVGGNPSISPVPIGSPARPRVIGDLNAWFAEMPDDTPQGVRIDRRRALQEAKLALMREVWDEATLGDYEAFHRWITVSFASGPPPAGSEAAAELFKRGSE